ncbi:NAD(P)H nitroreductase [Thalassotalea aquiviva]|uniref:NAD(P)H nitroreductase n=1 Tax=Thalassotalea aquiviva TaxID=3242415 RepID=UPI00352B1749
MSVLNFLLERQSFSSLSEPAPCADALNNILAAAMSVPDHGGLNPYQFHIVRGEGLKKLTDVFVEIVKEQGGDDFKLNKASKMAFRAPLIITVATNYKDHPKVPQQEQLITAGCAIYNMQMACVAQGFQGVWRTGHFAYNPKVKQFFKIHSNDDIVGFLYIGTPSKDVPIKKRKDAEDFVHYWE